MSGHPEKCLGVASTTTTGDDSGATPTPGDDRFDEAILRRSEGANPTCQRAYEEVAKMTRPRSCSETGTTIVGKDKDHERKQSGWRERVRVFLAARPGKARAERGESSPEDEFLAARSAISAWRMVVILLCVGLGLFLSLLDTTVVSTMLYSISDDFGAFRLSSWVVLSYTLSYVGCAVLIARVADVVGRKAVLIGCLVIFVVSSIACAACTSMVQLIGFRAIQGIGGSGLYSLAMIIYPEISPSGLVPAVSSILGVILALAGISGPLIGGLLSTYRSWRYVFWINVPCGLVPAVVLFLAWPSNTALVTPVKMRHLDYIGTALCMSGSILLVFIINQTADRVYSWRSGEVISVLAVSFLSMLALGAWEWVVSWHPQLRRIRPQIPFRLLSNRVVACGYLSTVCVGFVYLLVIINVPIRAQIVNVYNPIQAGLTLLPFMGAMAAGAALGGGVSSRKNFTFWSLNVAAVFALIGCVMLSTLPDALTIDTRQYGYECIVGFGIGMSLATMTFMTSMQVEFQDHACGQGIVAQLRIFGGSLGVAASFAVLNDKTASGLVNVLTPDQLADFFRSPDVTRKFSIQQQLAIRNVYLDAFSANMKICAGVTALGLLAGLFTYQRKPPILKERLAKLDEWYTRGAEILAARRDAANDAASLVSAPSPLQNERLETDV